MAILKVHNSILKANGKVLKAGGGGGLVYEFNLNQFNIETLKDGNVQWVCTDSTMMSKNDDCLICSMKGRLFQLYFRPNIDKSKKIICEYEIEFSLSDFFYAGLSCEPVINYSFFLVTIGSNYWFKNTGIVGALQNVETYNGGSYNTSWPYNVRYHKFPYTPKLKVRMEIEPDGIGKVYINDLICIIAKFSYDFDYFLDNFNFFISNGANEAKSGEMKLYNLKFYQE